MNARTKPPGFREQLESLLVIPSIQKQTPAPRSPAPPPPAPAPAPAPAEGGQPVAATAPDVPTFLRPTTNAMAETGLAFDLPIPRGTLPFVDPAEVVGGPRLEELPPPAESRTPSIFTGTVEAQVLPVPGRALPFTTVAEDLAATARLSSLPVPREPLPIVDETAVVLEGLSLRDHAALCADLAARPGDAARLFAARGLADMTRRRVVDDAWRVYLGSNASAYARWQDLYRRHASGIR